MVVVALTGGIASGKSTVADMLEKHGATCIDADHVAREIVEPGSPALEEIAHAFGSSVIHNGVLDRAALAAVIFTDEDARARLNAITHPRIRERTSELIAAASKENPNGVIIYAIPLLVETAGDRTFDAVVTVSASPDVRIQRLIEHRGMTRDEAKARVASQATEEERQAIADFVIDTNGTVAQTQAQVDDLWERLRNWDSA
jgi:dephospho-CoA kinase